MDDGSHVNDVTSKVEKAVEKVKVAERTNAIAAYETGKSVAEREKEEYEKKVQLLGQLEEAEANLAGSRPPSPPTVPPNPPPPARTPARAGMLGEVLKVGRCRLHRWNPF